MVELKRENRKSSREPSSAGPWARTLTGRSRPVNRTGVSWLLLARKSKGSSFSCSRLAFVLQRVEKGSDGGPGVRPEHRKTNGTP